MAICASMTLQSCQLIGVTEGLTILSYPNFLKSYLEQICFFFTDMFLRYVLIVSTSRGGSRIFIGGGGGAKDIWVHAHHEPEAKVPYGQGPGPT